MSKSVPIALSCASADAGNPGGGDETESQHLNAVVGTDAFKVVVPASDNSSPNLSLIHI